MIDTKTMLAAMQSSIETMPTDALIIYAKKYNIHQHSVNEFYLSNVNRIKARLTELGIDPETVRTE
tara:strand:+ start:502 stop:699 length:198 start_codon:yes stop_codon:yes gene_type:complete